MKCLEYQLDAIQDLKLGTYEKDATNENSYTYIPGSTIRGTLAWLFKNKEGEVPKVFFDGEVIFENAYPIINGQRMKPFYSCYGGDKKEMKSNSKEKNICLVEVEDEAIVPYSDGEFFYEGDSQTYIVHTPSIVDHLHIKKARDHTTDNKMFRYRAIEKNQLFGGKITGNEEYLEKIKDFLDREYIYVGGSRTSGYGKCEIKNVEIENIESKNLEFNQSDSYYIYFLSDTILYEDGINLAAITEEKMKKWLGIDAKIIKNESFVNLITASTYNSQYMHNDVTYKAIKKGSVIRFDIKNIELTNLDKCKEAMRRGIGLRTNVGYGKIEILTKKQLEMKKKAKRIEPEKSYETAQIVKFTKEQEKTRKNILKRIVMSRFEKEFDKTLMNIASNQNNIDGGNSQIGSVLSIISKKDSKEKLRKYLNHIEEDKRAYSKLNKIMVKTRNEEITLMCLLKKSLSENNNDYASRFVDFNAIGLDDYKLEITDLMILEMNVKLLKKLRS